MENMRLKLQVETARAKAGCEAFDVKKWAKAQVRKNA